MIPTDIELFWHGYKFFPYERVFAFREIKTLLQPKGVKEQEDRITISGSLNNEHIKKLVYFSHAQVNKNIVQTSQFFFENGTGKKIRQKRQNTRYSVHGLHEYKGKFNPQVVRSLFNIYGIHEGDKVFDPFCGSGTSLVEAAHDNVLACGTDVNPLATFIANAKIDALNVSSIEMRKAESDLWRFYLQHRSKLILENSLRIQYLIKWFPEETLKDIEALKLASMGLKKNTKNILLVIISNLLRDYSLQEPSDLRIRRRNSPFPEIDLITKIKNSIYDFITNIEDFQLSYKRIKSTNKAYNINIKSQEQIIGKFKNDYFDFAITSPPYATALPYIDTQRLSLVWLSLITPKQIKLLECELTGSRDYRVKSEQTLWEMALNNNSYELPQEIQLFCKKLQDSLRPNEGFRKKALPSLLYRYFYDMKLAFSNVHKLLKNDKFFCLIVGHNHTNIGGKRTDINTPDLLVKIGESVGFNLHEIIPLEVYHRYGINSLNAVQKESLIVFKK